MIWVWFYLFHVVLAANADEFACQSLTSKDESLLCTLYGRFAHLSVILQIAC